MEEEDPDPTEELPVFAAKPWRPESLNV